MKLKTLLQLAVVKLNAYSSTPQLDAELLLCKLLNYSRSQLITKGEEEVSAECLSDFDNLLERHIKGEPVAYILGYKEFWSLPVQVNPNVLIPRPETELLIELTLKIFPPNKKELYIADLGTGSGAIALAIAKEKPNWKIFAVDRSPSALQIAKQNAVNLKLPNIEFYLSDWFKSLPDLRFDLIISNPPYLAQNDPHLQQKELKFEPSQALVSGVEGLDDLEKIISQAPAYLKPKGWLMVEHGFDQADKVEELFTKRGYSQVASYKDLADLPRVTLGQISKN